MMTIAEINALTLEQFIEKFGDIAEDSPWFAEYAGSKGPFDNRKDLLNAFYFSVQNADRAMQRDLLRAHPDLAGKARLTEDSANEQKAAGLDSLNAEEFARFSDLNKSYRKKFGFPFILAVRGATKHQILESFAQRINNSKAKEYENALMEVMRIFRFRIEDRVAP